MTFQQSLLLHQLTKDKCLQGLALVLQSNARQVLELTVSKWITGTVRLSKAQMKEGGNNFSIVLYYLVRNPLAQNSSERAGAIALVARIFSFVLSLFFILIDNQGMAGAVLLLRKWCRHQHQGQTGSMHATVFPNRGPPCLDASRNPAGIHRFPTAPQ